MGLRYVDYSRYAACAAAPSAGAYAAADPAWGEDRAGGFRAAPDYAAEIPVCEERSAGAGAGAGRPGALAAFWLLYESRDRRLSLFETRDGHLAAVDPARLV